jgi:hypothetical protein
MESFESKARLIHSGKYGYEKSHYVNSKTPLVITCPTHGDFSQIPTNHLRGSGCPDCAGTKLHTTKTFIQAARVAHGDHYLYDRVSYKNAKTKVLIGCPDHSEPYYFDQSPSNHLRKAGCPKCGAKVISRTSPKDAKANFLSLAVEKHGDLYGYDEVVFVDNKTPVKIFCPEHDGFFFQTPLIHVRGFGSKCNICHGTKLKGVDQFVADASKKHGDRYSYEKSVYVNNKTKIVITCVKHGDFEQLPHDHLRGHGCGRCNGGIGISQDDFQKKADDTHGGKFDYSKTIFQGTKENITIICRNGHEFEQEAGGHMYGKGCAECAGVALKTTEQFIEEAIEKHDGKYLYDRCVYVNAKTKVFVGCESHSEPFYFEVTPNNHLSGNGCPKCPATRSRAEIEIEKYLVDNGINVVANDRSILKGGKELDLYLPDYKVAIEHNGLYYHSDQDKPNSSKKIISYHYNKWKECESLGIRLLSINEDEWQQRKDVLKRKILNLVGKSERGPGARKLTLSRIESFIANNFCEENHIQGATTCITYALGAYEGNNLVAVVTFSEFERQKYRTELSRFCTDGRIFAGLFGRMFKRALSDTGVTEVTTFADRRYSDGNLYIKTGFKHEGNVPVDFRYVKNGKTYDKRGFTKRQIAKKFNVDMAGKTERQGMMEQGFSRIYDCGKMRFIYDQLRS